MAAGDLDKQMRSHERSYSAFVTMIKWSTILSVITALLVILIIAD